MNKNNDGEKILAEDLSSMEFSLMDLRGKQGNFFPALKQKAVSLGVGEGFAVMQNFRPHPLYGAMEALGFIHYTEETKDGDFLVKFCRKEVLGGEDDKTPFKPVALLNFPMIDEELGRTAANFWNITWNSEKRTIPFNYRLLLSLANAVGAGRMRQASRELIKAYACGVSSAEFDDLFELFAWNQGIGFFSSEIGPSVLFKAYKLIKNMERQGMEREKIVGLLMKNFGENNPEVSVK